MLNPLIALRVGPSHWLCDDALEQLLTFLARQPDAVDEVALFSADTHPPLPLTEIERRSVRLKEVLPRIRAAGYAVGVNVLASMGHHEENLSLSLDGSWPRVTDPEGQVSLGAFCPADPGFQEYVRLLYQYVAGTAPDFIWIDDDVRLWGHMPIIATCFCDGCVDRFNHEVGGAFTRQSLVTLLRQPAGDDTWQRRWLAHNRQMIEQFLRLIAETVHSVDSAISLGFMTGDRFYEGYGFVEWAAALSGDQSGPARWRPGGGFYADDTYMGLVEKAHDIGRQVSQLPAQVSIIQSEIENFPYQKLRKSVEITVLEGAAHMAAGATGIAFNVLNLFSQPHNTHAEYAPFLERIAQVRPFYQRLQETTGRGWARGVWPAWQRDLFCDPNTEDWFQSSRTVKALRQLYTLAEIGLPIAYGQKGACVTALSGPLPAQFSHDELEKIFSSGVLLDGAAVQTLQEMGLDVAAWVGIGLDGMIDKDTIELLTDHTLNGPYASYKRDCRQSFWGQPAYRLRPESSAVEPLARLVDYSGVDLGLGMTAFENALGGRVVVMGYYPWTLIHTQAKTSQLKALCRWLSRNTLPGVVETYARAPLWTRDGANGEPVFVVLNASLDPVPELVLRLHTETAQISCLSMAGQEEVLSTQSDGDNHVLVTLLDVPPWSIYLLA
jgi:hypothetical protein